MASIYVVGKVTSACLWIKDCTSIRTSLEILRNKKESINDTQLDASVEIVSSVVGEKTIKIRLTYKFTFDFIRAHVENDGTIIKRIGVGTIWFVPAI